MRYTRLSNESADYIASREDLRVAEIELMRQQERVAEMRRHLPLGPPVKDYVFQEGPADLDRGDTPIRNVRLSELFSGPGRPVFVYHFMYGKKQTAPCPMCTLWIDGFDGVAHHLRQNVDVAIVAAAGLPTLRAYARDRGWRNLRLLSAGDNSFKYDFLSEDEDGNQDSTVSVFTRDKEGQVRHFYTGRPKMSEDIHERGIDLLCPVWNLLDLTPAGRGEWYSEVNYPDGARRWSPEPRKVATGSPK